MIVDIIGTFAGQFGSNGPWLILNSLSTKTTDLQL